jgi:hypothetical protein
MDKTKPFQPGSQAGTDIFFQVDTDVICFSGTGLRNFCHRRVFLRDEVILPA